MSNLKDFLEEIAMKKLNDTLCFIHEYGRKLKPHLSS